MSSLTDAQAALAAANTVLADVNALNVKHAQMGDMLQRLQTSASPVSPSVMTLKRSVIVDAAAMLVDITAAVAAVQVVVTDLGG